jgi:trk system potassium uptake protein
LSKQFAIIGLGRFGGSVAQTLHSMGYEVLAVDRDPSKVQDMSQIVTQAIEADSTDENALKALGIRNFDVIVVAIGEDIQSSIMTTLILKELGVKKIVVKAQNELHGKVLVHNLISPNILDYVELSDDHSIIEVKAPTFFEGKTLQELDIRARFGCSIMAIKSNNHYNIAPAATEKIHAGDNLVVIGHNDHLTKFEEACASDSEE